MQQSYTFASFTSQHTSQSLQKSGLPNRTDTASQWTAKPRQKEGKLVTASKQYCLAAGVTQGNIAYTQTLIGKFTDDINPFIIKHVYLKKKKYETTNFTFCYNFFL